jgi:transcriptional regulator with XRE-family HTH domain
MNEQFIRDRISALRIKKGISEYKMSLDLGHSKSYIQSISSGKSLPSLAEFLYICEYLEVTPKDFFDADVQEPSLVNELTEQVKEMQDEDLIALINIAKRINLRY